MWNSLEKAHSFSVRPSSGWDQTSPASFNSAIDAAEAAFADKAPRHIDGRYLMQAEAEANAAMRSDTEQRSLQVWAHDTSGRLTGLVSVAENGQIKSPDEQVRIFDEGRLATVQAALDDGCPLIATCVDCERTRPLDLERLVSDGYGETRLGHLPLRCECGSRRTQIMIDAPAYVD